METNLSFAPETSQTILVPGDVDTKNLDMAKVLMTGKESVAIELVTPELARYWYDNLNSRNRKGVSPQWPKELAQRIACGEWVLTPETICFDEDGNFIDGQNRLLGIIMSGKSMYMVVCRGFSREAYEVIDRGMRRSDAQVMRRDRNSAKVLSFIARHTSPRGYQYEPRVSELLHVEEAFGPLVDEFLANCNSGKRILSTPSVKAAAIAHIVNGVDKQYVFDMYRNMHHGSFDLLPKIGRLFLNRVQDRTRVGFVATDWPMIYACAWVAFDPKKANNSKLNVSADPESNRDRRCLNGITDKVLQNHLVNIIHKDK